MPPKGLASEMVRATRSWPPSSWTYQRATMPPRECPTINYDALPLKTFYLRNVGQTNDGNDVLTALRLMLDPETKIYFETTQNAILIRGCPDELTTAEKVLGDLDLAGEGLAQRGLQPARGAGHAPSLDVVGRHGRGRRHVVVVPAVLVVDPDQHGVRPAGAVHDPVDHLGGEALALPDVLRVLLRIGPEVRVHDAERRQRAAGGVGEELV